MQFNVSLLFIFKSKLKCFTSFKLNRNSSLVLNTFKKAAYAYTLFVNNHRLKTFSNYRVETTHVGPKLLGQLDLLKNKLDVDELKEVLYGTIDTWLVWNITKEKIFATDVTCASSTGLFDMYLVSF